MWKIRGRVRLARGVGVSAALLLLVGEAAARAQQPVSANWSVRVVEDRAVEIGLEGRILVYPHLAGHPDDPDHLLGAVWVSGPAANYQGRIEQDRCATLLSRDGGRSWQRHDFRTSPAAIRGSRSPPTAPGRVTRLLIQRPDPAADGRCRWHARTALCRARALGGVRRSAARETSGAEELQTAARQRQVLTYRACSVAAPGELVPLERNVPAGTDPVEAALTELVKGVTSAEAARGCTSLFTPETEHAVAEVRRTPTGDTIIVTFRNSLRTDSEAPGARSFLPPA